MAGRSLKHLARGGRQAGSHWEDTAERYLRAQGLILLQRNFSSRFGEIDLIMEDRRTVVFVEVKYRGNNSHGSGAEAVTYHKQHKLSLTAACFLAANPGRSEQNCRFDVISIDPQRDEYDIEWIRNAFYSTAD